MWTKVIDNRRDGYSGFCSEQRGRRALRLCNHSHDVLQSSEGRQVLGGRIYIDGVMDGWDGIVSWFSRTEAF